MSISGYVSEQVKGLHPPVQVSHVRHLSNYIHIGQGLKADRKIFHNVPYSEFEEQGIQKMLDHFAQKGIRLPADWEKSESLKFIYNCNFELKKSLELIKPHLVWREKPQPLTPFIESIMNSGFLFAFGKDKQFRPIVYVRLGVMKKKALNGLSEKLDYPDLDPAIDWILTLIRKECYRGYFVENWIMIIDAADMGIFSFPVKFFTNLMGMTQINHPACLHKMFIVNTATSMGAVWKMASPFLAKETQEKITFLKKKEISKMHQYIDPSQVLEEYGGTLKMPAKFWPPPDSYTAEQRDTVMPVNEPEGAAPDQRYQYEAQSNAAKFCAYSIPLHENKLQGRRLDYDDEASLYTIPQESKPHGIEIFDDQLVLEFQHYGRFGEHQELPKAHEKSQQKPSMASPRMMEPQSVQARGNNQPSSIEEVRLTEKPNSKDNSTPTLQTIPPPDSQQKSTGCCSGACASYPKKTESKTHRNFQRVACELI